MELQHGLLKLVVSVHEDFQVVSLHKLDSVMSGGRLVSETLRILIALMRHQTSSKLRCLSTIFQGLIQIWTTIA